MRTTKPQTKRRNEKDVSICSIPGCTNRQSDTTSVHAIPRNETIRSKWIEFIKEGGKHETEIDPSRDVICSAHFVRTDFVADVGYCVNFFEIGARRRLKVTATPTIYTQEKEVSLFLFVCERRARAHTARMYKTGQKVEIRSFSMYLLPLILVRLLQG